jgi:hypothetical protein
MVVGSPSRNNPHCLAALRERDKEGFAVHFANRLTAFLAIVLPPVDTFQSVRVGEHPRRMGKIEAAFRIRPAAFGIVPLEYHMGGTAV